MPDTVVTLSRRYEHPFDHTFFDTVVLREPRYVDVFADGMGPPVEYQPNGSGGAMIVTHFNIIDDYITRLAIKPGREVLGELSAIDTMRLAKAVTDFFTEPAASSTMPTG